MRTFVKLIASILFLNIDAIAQPYYTYPATKTNTEQAFIPENESFADTAKIRIEQEWNRHLIINSDSRVDTLLEIHREENLRKVGLDGFRVQIFQGTKEEAYQVKGRFISAHENTRAYVSFNAPDFRVRVGDFRTRSEAIKIKQEVKNEYPAAYVVDDFISFPDLYSEEIIKH